MKLAFNFIQNILFLSYGTDVFSHLISLTSSLSPQTTSITMKYFALLAMCVAMASATSFTDCGEFHNSKYHPEMRSLPNRD